MSIEPEPQKSAPGGVDDDIDVISDIVTTGPGADDPATGGDRPEPGAAMFYTLGGSPC